MRMSYPTPLPETQCVQVNVVTVTPDCPVSGGAVRQITLGLTTSTNADTLLWRGASQSADVLNPPSGTIVGSGTSTVNIQDTVGDAVMKFEVVDSGGNVLLRLTLSNH
ncbi:MAG TPA: hypothetical protein VN083_05840 [Vicinamibacteria bacterium]|nr:hypothetical protein [Vicinamibacteria bacterium]